MKETMDTKTTLLYLVIQYWLIQSIEALQHNWAFLSDRPLAVLDALEQKKEDLETNVGLCILFTPTVLYMSMLRDKI